MSGSADGYCAIDETIVSLDHFKDPPDPRQIGKVTYPLEAVLLLCLLGVLAGAECFTEIARFGERKLALLRRFRLSVSNHSMTDSRYIGESDNLARRFVNYRTPGSSLPTNIRINTILLARARRTAPDAQACGGGKFA